MTTMTIYKNLAVMILLFAPLSLLVQMWQLQNQLSTTPTTDPEFHRQYDKDDTHHVDSATVATSNDPIITNTSEDTTAADNTFLSSDEIKIIKDDVEEDSNTVQKLSSTSSSNNAILLQTCLDEYTSKGSWVGNQWVLPPTTKMDDACPSFDKYPQPKDISLALTNLTIGFMGDSTTRSDLRAWEETFGCPRTNLDEAQIFQRKHRDGSYICDLSEQSVNLTKCGYPPIVNITHCPPSYNQNSNNNNNNSNIMSPPPPQFRYFYKVYPWTPLDRWYFEHQSMLFSDLDALVISIGRWFPYAERQMNVTQEINDFLTELKKVYSGLILFQSQYGEHTISVEKALYPVNCTHGLMDEEFECESTITHDRPQADDEIRSVVVSDQHQIAFLDRWDISKTLPIEHYDSWLCGKPNFHSWYCDHHLGFVAMQHLRLIASVIISSHE